MNNTQINSFIEAGKQLTPGLYLQETENGFKTTNNAADGMPLEKITEVAQNCLSTLKKKQDNKTITSLLESLQNIEQSLKTVNCFAKIYAKTKESVFDKLPLVLWGNVSEFVVPKEWAKNEAVAPLFKKSMTDAKIWQKEAAKLGLEGDIKDPQKAKEAVLEYYRELPDMLTFNRWVLDELKIWVEDDPHYTDQIAAIQQPFKKQQVLLNLFKNKTEVQSHDLNGFTKSLLLRLLKAMSSYVPGKEDSKLKGDSYCYLKLIECGLCDATWFGDNFFWFESIKDLSIRQQILKANVKNLPQLTMPTSGSLLNNYLSRKKEYFDFDIAIQMLDKCTDANSNPWAYPFIERAYIIFAEEPDKCKILISKLIQKGERRRDSHLVKIPDEMQKFIAEEIAKADKK